MAQNSDNSRYSSWSGACHWSCYEKGRIRYTPSGICQDWDNGESFIFSSWTQAGGNFLFLEVKWLAATDDASFSIFLNKQDIALGKAYCFSSNLWTQYSSKILASWTKLLLFVYVDLTRGDHPLSVCYALLWHNFNAEIWAVDFPPLLRKLMEGHFGYVDGGFQGTDSPELSPVRGLAQ